MGWSDAAEAFRRDGVVRFASGLAMDVRLPIEWPQPFPHLSRTAIAKDVCSFIDTMRAAGFGYRPLAAVTPVERREGETFFADTLARVAIEAVARLAPGTQTEWRFGAILIGITQFAAKVERDARMVIARVDVADGPSPPHVLSLLGEFIAIGREQFELESQRMSSLAAQGHRTPRPVQ